jgi:hypothetical protein
MARSSVSKPARAARAARRPLPQAIRAIAARVADEATSRSFNDYMRLVAAAHPTASSKLAIQAYVQALRVEVDRMANAEARR